MYHRSKYTAYRIINIVDSIKLFLISLFEIFVQVFLKNDRNFLEITNELEANELLIILISFPISFFLSFLLIFVEYIFEASQNFYRNSSIHFFNEKNIYTIFKKYKI